jgi:hypothetical protein
MGTYACKVASSLSATNRNLRNLSYTDTASFKCDENAKNADYRTLLNCMLNYITHGMVQTEPYTCSLPNCIILANNSSLKTELNNMQ